MVIATQSILCLVMIIILIAQAKERADYILRSEERKKIWQWTLKTGKHPSLYAAESMFTFEEIIQLTWRCFIPVFIMIIISIVFLVTMNNSLHNF